MTPSSVLPFVGLAALGALVELDERGLFAGILRTPVLVGALTGWVVGHAAAVWAARRDPLFADVGRRHLRIPSHLSV